MAPPPARLKSHVVFVGLPRNVVGSVPSSMPLPTLSLSRHPTVARCPAAVGCSRHPLEKLYRASPRHLLPASFVTMLIDTPPTITSAGIADVM